VVGAPGELWSHRPVSLEALEKVEPLVQYPN
jgi:hypothetical protein